ncbi:tocopherol phytyltransferase [bacterium BMS3Abin05]|nr:tocopherol phytyltransferase [bacterium BMS3Abin05]GBE26411.1 tocopherol phytyltransferase [bacterium BMS3Bbin03]HDK36578.1 hypothetical protein [Bacteroidota bacterium]HDZ11124.1 hypothetical protein [Bacteroidota bacterium]
MKRWIKPFDYVFLLRPVLFYPVWTIFLAGILSVQGASSGYGWPEFKIGLSSRHLDKFLFAFVGYSLLMGAVFIINQLTDISTDRKNSKLFLIADEHVSPRAAVREILIVLFIAFGLALNTSGWFLLVMFAALIVTGVAYSLPPFFLKNKPLYGLLVNLSGGMLTFFAGWLAISGPSLQMAIRSLPYVFAVGAVYFLTTILDAEGDLHSQKITFAVYFGMRTTLQMAVLFDAVAAVLAFVVRDWIIFISAVISCFLFVFLFIKKDSVWLNRATRLPILLLAFIEALYLPVYFLGIIGIYLLSKWYYRNRFGLNYPSLNPSHIGKEA